MDTQEKILFELSEIRKLLTIFAQDKLDAFNLGIKEKYLTSVPRQKMYDLFNGEKSLKEIADELGVSSEAVRQFAVTLEKAGLLSYTSNNSGTKLPKRLF